MVSIFAGSVRSVTMAFKIQPCGIPGPVEIIPDIYGDERGFFLETFKASGFQSVLGGSHIVQVNHSLSRRHVLRGLHLQREPAAQGKIVTVVSGQVFDVAVDVRPSSENFGRWVGVNLDAKKKNMMVIPRGFAHGFCVLSDEAQIIYYCTDNEYSPEHEQTVLWNDPDIGIEWPVTDPILSERDKQGKMLKELC